MHPRVSLLLPNRNNERTLDLVFERLLEHTTYADVEVVVVDDGSTDGSREILRRWRDSGRFARFLLEEQPPSGVVVALNRLLELATGDVCVQLDADATVETPAWIEKLLGLLLADERVGVVSPRVVFDSDHVHAYGVNVVGAEGFHDRGTRILEPAGRRVFHQNVERLRDGMAPYGDEVAEVDAGIGCCMMYRRADALAVGGYDLGFQPVWFDDVDLALSIRHRLGKKNFYVPHVTVVHRIGARDRSEQPSRREVLQARVGAMLPPTVKEELARRTGLGMPPEQAARLRHHYAYWREKWGWDLLNPDMDAVRERYAGSELLWADDPVRRAAGVAIADRYEAAAAGTSAESAQRYLRRFGFLPPPAWSTLTEYGHILDVVRDRGLDRLDGDFVEIGVFLGGGTYQLARIAPERRVVGIDLFAPATDETEATTGTSMAAIYAHVLGAGDQRELYDAVVSGCPNVVTIAGDSAEVELPCERIAFAHVDGNHDPAYVRSDFERLWPLVVPGGVLAFDDYGHDLPQVTATIDALRREHGEDIAAFWVAGRKTAFLERR